MQVTKLCRECGDDKPIEAFTPRLGGRWRELRCRPCAAERMRQRRFPPAMDGVKECSRCGDVLPITEFSRAPQNVDGRLGHCEPCRKWSKRSRDYGLPIEVLKRRLDAQGHRCAICGEAEPPVASNRKVDGWHFDHDHRTGRPRGFLCFTCNQRLGVLESDPQWVEAARAYLARYAVD